MKDYENEKKGEDDITHEDFIKELKKYNQKVAYEYYHQYYELDSILEPKYYAGFNSRWDWGHHEYAKEFKLRPKHLT